MLALEYILVILRAACIGTMLTLGLTYKSKYIKQRALSVFSAILFLLVVYVLLRIVIKINVSLSCDIAFTVGICAYGLFCFRDNIGRRLVLSFGSALLTVLCARLCVLAFMAYPGHEDFLYRSSNGISSEIVILSIDIYVQLIVHGIFITVWNRLLKVRGAAVYNIVIYLIFPMSQFIIVFFLNGKEAYDRLFSNPLSLFGMLVGCIADIVFYYTVLNQERKKELQIKLEETRRLYEIEKAYNDAVLAGKEEIDKLSCEFNGKLTAIIDNWEQGNNTQADILFERLKTEVAATKEREYCDNSVVNAVLTEKENRAKERFISMEINLVVEQEISVSPVHLCSVFSNMLDNAIRATAEYTGDRVIRVGSGYAGGYFFVSVENSCKKPERKSIRKGHGYGLEILNDIAKQYDGRFNHGWHDDTYTSRIMLAVR